MRVPIVAFQEDAFESGILFFRFVPFIDSEDAWSILADALDEGRSRGIEPSAAAGLSILLWIALTLPLLIGGFVAVFLTGVSLGEIHKHAHAQHRRHREHRETPAPPSR